MKLKKILSLTLVAGLMMNVTGCAKSPQKVVGVEEQPIPSKEIKQELSTINRDERITLTVMGPKHPFQSEWKDMTFWKEVSEKFNVDFEFETPPKENYEEKFNLRMASKDLPDLVLASLSDMSTELMYGTQGTIIPLNDLIDEYAPNIQKCFEEYPDVKDAITTPNGDIYSIPEVIKHSIAQVNQQVWVNGHWLEALNITEMPETVDELYDLLVKLRDGDPNKNGKKDEVPIACDMQMVMRPYLLSVFGMASNDLEVVEDKIRFNPATENYKAYLTFVKKLYDEKLIDTNMFTQNFQQMVAKSKEGVNGVASAAVPSVVFDADSTIHKPLPPVVSDYAKQKVVPIKSGVNRGTAAITVANEHPERTMEIIDYMYSEEGSLLAHYGPENGFWKWSDSSQTKRETIKPAEGQTAGQLRGQFTPAVGINIPKWSRIEVEKTFADDFSTYRYEVADTIYMPYGKIACPDLYLLEKDQQIVTPIKTDLINYIQQMEAKFITGAESLDNFDAYIQQLDQMGLQQYLNIYQAAYDQYKITK